MLYNTNTAPKKTKITLIRLINKKRGRGPCGPLPPSGTGKDPNEVRQARHLGSNPPGPSGR